MKDKVLKFPDKMTANKEVEKLRSHMHMIEAIDDKCKAIIAQREFQSEEEVEQFCEPLKALVELDPSDWKWATEVLKQRKKEKESE